MTGYGRAENKERGKVLVEIRSLNSRYLDVNTKTPKYLLSKEIEIKNIAGKRLNRGKVTVVMDIEQGDENGQLVNEGLFQRYYQQFERLAVDLNVGERDIFKLALQAPGVMDAETDEEVSDEDWEIIKSALIKALEECENHRIAEGNSLQTQLTAYIQSISTELEQVKVKDPERVEAIRSRLGKQMEEFEGLDKWDENRFEQELIYYVEKLDIQEELVRLRTHLAYFIEVMEESKKPAGKKLGFISQEIGREINTIGSKANDADIQRHVVVMKEELEKIKEQLQNVV